MEHNKQPEEFKMLLLGVRGHHQQWCWEVFNEQGKLLAHARERYDDYGAALNAGTVALARLEGQTYENEAADPVGENDIVRTATHPTHSPR